MSQKGKHVKKNESSKMNNVNKRKRASKRKNKRNYNDRDKSFKKKELLNEDEKDSKKVITKSDKNGNKKKSSKKNVFAKIVGNFSKKTHTNRGNSEKKKIKMSPLITKICVFIVVIIIVILVCVNLLNNSKEENAVAQTEEQKEENVNIVTQCDLLDFKMYSLRDILWLKQERIKMELPEVVDLTAELKQEKGIKNLIKTMFHKKKI